MPVIVQRGAQFARQGCRHLCRGADADPFGPSVQKIIEILQLQYIDKVIDVWFAGPAVFGAVVEETAELPQLRRFAQTLALHMPVVVQRQLPGVSDGSKLRRSRSCSTFQSGRCPCCAGGHLGASSSWRRSLTCPFCQRQWCCSQWRCLKFSSPPVFVDIPVAQLRRVRRFQLWRLWRR